MIISPNLTQRILGGLSSHFLVGVGPHTIPSGKRGFAIVVRTQGTIIAGVTVQSEPGVAAAAYTPAPSWQGIALNQGDYIVSEYPIATITLTAATDSIIVYADKPY